MVAPALAQPGVVVPVLVYTEDSAGLPHERPGEENDAGWTGMRFADFNGDGWPDLAVVGRKGDGAQPYVRDPEQGRWRLSDGGMAPRFSLRNDLRFGDVDGDGRIDLVESNGWVWLGDGAGGWSEGPQRLPFGGEDVAVGDVDMDGDLDVAVLGHLSGGLRLFLNDGSARWTRFDPGLPDSGWGHKLAFADLDADGCLDVVASFTYRPTAWLGDCAGHWREARTGLGDFQGWGVAAGDVDGDGHADLAFGVFHAVEGDQGVQVYRGDGAGTWSPWVTFLADKSIGGLAMGDVDGDGDLDVVAGEQATNNAGVFLYVNDGAGRFAEALSGLPFAGDEMEGLALGDVDRDGLLDVGIPRYGDDGVEVWRAALPARGVRP